MMKKVKAAKSTSDISLRKGATGAAATRSALPPFRTRKGYAPAGKGSKVGKSTNDRVKKVKSTRAKKQVDSNIEDAVIVPSTRTNMPANKTTTSSKPKAIAGPSKPPSKSKKSGGPKTPRDKTRTVFVAEPRVTLDDGPDFGKITHEISKTKQPVNPRQFR